MSEELVFSMGKYEAIIPRDRSYSENHLWLKPDGETWQVGFTAYSVRLLQDVYFLDWFVEPNTLLRKRQEIGEIESSKALSSLYTPFDGTLTLFNEELLDDPSGINTDNYGRGWLFRFQTDAELLTPQGYLEILEAGWDETQRHLKGQLH